MHWCTPLAPIKFCLVAILLLVSWSCSSVPDAEPPQPLSAQTTPSRLESPLWDYAQLLAATRPATNHLTLLEIGEDALLARIHLIRSASRSIAIQTMIWANDETGRYIIYELIQAARRGVEVRLLIDHVASEHNLEVACFLASVHPNFHVKLFNPMVGFLGHLKAKPSYLDKIWSIAFKFNRLNQRMHNKTFVIDGVVGITGGRNYQNAYYDQALGMNYKDRDLLVIGSVVKEMQNSFNDYWTFERSIRLQDLVDVRKHMNEDSGKRWLTRESFQLNGFFADIEADVNNSSLISTRFIEPLNEVDAVYFVADEPHKRDRSFFENDGRSVIASELASMVSEAKQSVFVQTPYLVLSPRAIELFKTIRERHPEIDIRVSTNSLAATDSWYVYALSYQQKKIYLAHLKFKIFEYKPLPEDMQTIIPSYAHLKIRAEKTFEQTQERFEQTHHVPEGELFFSEEGDEVPMHSKTPYLCLHAKSLVVDDSVSFVGSYNLDPRSENINTECGLIIRDRTFAQLLKHSIETDMKPQNSWVIARKKRFIGVDQANTILLDLSRLIPIVDLWPFRHTASFELIEGKPAVEIGHDDFYDNYRDVGSFPTVKSNGIGKEIGARGTKAFLSFVKPLL